MKLTEGCTLVEDGHSCVRRLTDRSSFAKMTEKRELDDQNK
jgi:hypothetical protein